MSKSERPTSVQMVDARDVIMQAIAEGESPSKALAAAMEARIIQQTSDERDPMKQLYRHLASVAIDTTVEALFNAEKWSDKLSAARDLQDRAGLAPVQRVAQKIQVELSPESIAALTRAAVRVTAKE